jgi:hypothetical protein
MQTGSTPAICRVEFSGRLTPFRLGIRLHLSDGMKEQFGLLQYPCLTMEGLEKQH